MPFVLVVGLVGGLIVIEPDMGTTGIILLVAATLFFMAGAPLSHLTLLMLAGGLISVGLVLAQDYRLDRLAAFLSAEADPQGTGFQVLQLLIALGSGGPFGLGWGVSRQKFFYVPSAHTDGVFAIAGEELGFIGTVTILGLFAFLLYRGFKTVANARGPVRHIASCWGHQLDWISGDHQYCWHYSHDSPHRGTFAIHELRRLSIDCAASCGRHTS